MWLLDRWRNIAWDKITIQIHLFATPATIIETKKTIEKHAETQNETL